MNYRNLTEYDIKLWSSLESLSKLPKKSGGEGVVFELDKNYVVKKYSKKRMNPKKFDDVFKNYCKEIQHFSDMGLSTPKIYSWLQIGIPDNSLNGLDNFILEENVHGRELFLDYLDSLYFKFVDECNEDEFESVIDNPMSNRKLYDEIVKEFFKDFIEMNKKIIDMPEKDLEKFLSDIYLMTHVGEYSCPDIFSNNVLIDGTKMTLIDNVIVDPRDVKYNKENMDGYFMKGLVQLFLFNEDVLFPEETILSDMQDYLKEFNFIEKYQEENKKVCKKAMERVLKLANKSCGNPKCQNQHIYEYILTLLERIFGTTNLPEITNELGFGE